MDPAQAIPRVGIVIANYNYGRYLNGCLESALAQTYPKCDILIIDSNSTDNSKDVINQFVSQYEKTEERIYNGQTDTSHVAQICPEINCVISTYKNGDNLIVVYQLEKPVGPSGARNIAIADTLEFTDCYQILDADDEIYPTKVQTLVEYLYQSRHVGAVYADYDILNIDTGNITREYKEPYDKQRLLEECIVHSGSLIKKDAILNTVDNHGIYDREMRTCEDYDLWIRISEKGVLLHVPQSLSLVRVHDQNATNSVKTEVWQQNWQRIQQKLHARHKK